DPAPRLGAPARSSWVAASSPSMVTSGRRSGGPRATPRAAPSASGLTTVPAPERLGGGGLPTTHPGGCPGLGGTSSCALSSRLMTYDEIVRGLREPAYELHNEGRRVRAGLNTEQDTASIIGRYAWLYSDEALAVVGEPVDEAGRRVRAALLQGIVDRRTAAHEDRLSTFFATATAPVGGEQVPFFTAQAMLAKE